MQRRRYAGCLAVVFSILCAVGLAGCGGTKESLDVTHLQIDEAGMITHTMIEDFDTSVYNVAELEAMVQEEITQYGNEFQDGTVTLVSAAMSETEANKLIVTMQFSNSQAYSDFNGVDMFFGTIAEAREKGYNLEKMTFADAADAAKTVSFSDLAKGHILIINENIPVNLPYKILYISGNAELRDKNTVSGFTQDTEEQTGQTDGCIYVITK